jgi:hypothetical protein
MTYIEEINAAAMDQFLEALDSGKYPQGYSRLHTRMDDSMCCLGVATTELGPQCGVKLIPDTTKFSQLAYHYEDTNGVTYYLLMPPAVTKFLGIPADYIDSTGSGDVILVLAEGDDLEEAPDGEGGYYKGGNYLTSVSALNDQGVSHPEIARRIRETFSVKES